jgi:hypothetical protein|tara:strand:+ start:76 stop:525 length:450 start_codon:yes stop_codon:yes gene_type:complete
MGCNNSKTLEEDLAAGDAAASALAGETATTDTLDNEEDDVPTKTFGKPRGFDRRDSIKYNKEAIEKRKKHNQNITDGVENKSMPRAFMKPGSINSGPVIKKSNKQRGFNRRDSIKINKDAMEKKKKRASANKETGKGFAPSGIDVQVVE